MSRPLRVAIMSFAHHHSNFYLPPLLADPGVEVLTSDEHWRSATGDAPRGPAVAERFGAPYVETYQELLDWGPDAVIVCSENTRHRHDVERAAAAGAHVMCEKPLATTAEDAAAMVAACREAGVFLMTAYPIRFTPMYRRLRAAVADGAIGRIVGAVGTNNGTLPMGGAGWFTDPALSGGGAVADLTVHIVDLMDDLLGDDRVARVSASTNAILYRDQVQDGIETAGLVTVTTRGGVSYGVDCSWSHPPQSPTWGGLTLSVTGTEGQVEIDPFGLRVGGFDEASGKDFWLAYGPNAAIDMLGAFLTGIREGRAPSPTGADGYRSAVVLEAALRSAREGRTIEVGDRSTALDS